MVPVSVMTSARSATGYPIAAAPGRTISIDHPECQKRPCETVVDSYVLALVYVGSPDEA